MSFKTLIDSDLLHRFPTLEEFAGRLGNTPLVELPRRKTSGRVLAKCEWHNPTGSVKDRAAFCMIYDLLKKAGGDSNGLRIVEYSGGNLAVSLAQLCEGLSIPCTLVLSAASPLSLVEGLREKGATIALVEKSRGFWGVMEEARRLAADDASLTLLDQHTNPANIRGHQEITGQEIADQLKAFVRSEDLSTSRINLGWVAAIGTGGTLAGVHDALIERCPGVRSFGLTPKEQPYAAEVPPNGLPKFVGSGGLGCGRKQMFVAAREADIEGQFTVSLEDALAAKRLFFELTKIWIGSSAAAAWLAAMDVGDQLGDQSLVVTLFACQGTDNEKEAAMSDDIGKRAEELRCEWALVAPTGPTLATA